MPELHQFPVVTTTGRQGRIYRTSRFLDRSEHTRVTFDDGEEFTVPSEAVRAQPDGSFLLDDSYISDSPPPRTAPPPAPENDRTPSDQRSVAPENDRIPVDQRSVLVDEPLYFEDVEVERVPVNRIIDQPVETRHEGDTMIVPVVEEVVTIQKRLLLKEEVHIRRRRTEVREPRRVIVQNGEIRVFGADGRPLQL
jgi:hypothetical protein